MALAVLPADTKASDKSRLVGRAGPKGGKGSPAVGRAHRSTESVGPTRDEPSLQRRGWGWGYVKSAKQRGNKEKVENVRKGYVVLTLRVCGEKALAKQQQVQVGVSCK